MIGGFQPRAFQPCYQQVSGSSGGFWPEYEYRRLLRAKRRREIEEAEEDAKRITDEVTRQIYLLERQKDVEEAEKLDLGRLQKIADRYSGQRLDELSKPARMAILNAQDARTRNSLEQLRRIIDQQMEEEEMAVIMMLLSMDD